MVVFCLISAMNLIVEIFETKLALALGQWRFWLLLT